MNENVHVVNHPLLSHKLTILRDKNTSTKDFREIVSEIGMLLTYEATRDLPLTTKEIETPICKMPRDIAERDVLIVDPMLATGGSADAAIQIMKGYGCQNIKLMVLVAAPKGIEVVTAAHPDVEIYCGAVDQGLNEASYIVPGLGDAGDRIFGTK